MRNLTHKWKQSGHFLPKIRAPFLISEKGWGSPPPLVAHLYWSNDNTKAFNLFGSTSKLDNNYSSSKLISSSFFFFFFFFLRYNLLFISSAKVFAIFNKRTWHWINFYQLEDSCSTAITSINHTRLRGASYFTKNWCPNSLSFLSCNFDRFSPAWRFA